MAIKSYTFKGYKCFVEKQEFDAPQLVNLVIGRNNSGKSSFLDIIHFLYSDSFETANKIGMIQINYVIDDKDISKISIHDKTCYTTTGYVKMDGKGLIGKYLTFSMKYYITSRNIERNDTKIFTDVYPRTRYEVDCSQFLTNLEKQFLKEYSILRIASERDIYTEELSNSVPMDEHGNHFTSNIAYLKTNKHGNRKMIDNILKELNDLLKGENEYSSFLALEEKGKYAIHLTNDYGEIKIDDMGSGLKTLLMVLYTLEVAKAKKDAVLLFEELENNLHPEVQRRLFSLIYDFAIKNRIRVFITTHSSVAIDCFSSRDDTKIYHIKKIGESTSVIETVNNYQSKAVVLEDLGVKASDILQSNGIIWVEGPSDRVYIKKWLHLMDPTLEENKHYSFLYYGGRNLAHFTSDEEASDLINILLTNRNSAIVIDSDKSNDEDNINNTKKRIQNEFNSKNMLCWITKGREIENYVSKNAVIKKYPKSSYEQIGQYDDFKNYISNDYTSFENNKVAFAKSLSFDGKEDLEILDLKEKLSSMINEIKRWNKL